MGDTGERRGRAPRSDLSHRGASERGWYLLEYAVVIFGVAVFIVGFSDITRIFHARGAVRAGVTEGLRCLYPTDAGCSDQDLNNGWFPNDRFNARITGDQTNRYEFPRVSYGLTSSWFNEPVSEASFATKQLTGVTLTQPQDAYRQYQVLFPGTAHAVYLLKTQELPRVATGTGSSAEQRVLNPRFLDPETLDNRGADQTLTAPNLSLQTNRPSAGSAIEGEVSFTIPSSGILSQVGNNTLSLSELKAYQAAYGFTASCYEGTRQVMVGGSQGIQWPPNGSPAACAYRNQPGSFFNGSEFKVPIMIHVSGYAYLRGASSNDWTAVRGSVELELWQDGRRLRYLGGRSFTRTGRVEEQWGNFVVRGAGRVGRVGYDAGARYLDDCVTAEYSECFNEDYVHLPLVKVDTPITLKFSLKWAHTGKGAAEPKVKVSWGRQEEVEDPKDAQIRIFHPRFQATHEQRSCGYSAQPNSCGLSVAPMQTSFTTTNLDQAFSYSDRPETQCDRSPPSGFKPSINSALEEFRGEIRAKARSLAPIAFWSRGTSDDRCSPKVSPASCSETPREYMKGCEPEYQLPGDAVALCTLNDYQSQRDTISNPSFSYGKSDRLESRKGCSQEPFPECAQEHLKGKGEVFFGAVSNNCAVALPRNAESYQSGPLYKNTCVDELPGFIEKYRKEQNIPEQAPVYSYTRQETPVISKNPPDDSCREFNPIDGPSGRNWLCAERSSYAVANNCCKTYGEQDCSIERVSVGDGGGQGGGFGQVVEGARQRTLQTVQAAYPPAKMDLTCGQNAAGEPSEDDCIDIQAGPVDNGTRARVQASMRVPLALFDWFGMDNHTVVQYEETRTLESSLVGEVG